MWMKSTARYLRRLYRAAFCREPIYNSRLSVSLAMAVDPDLTLDRALYEADLRTAMRIIGWYRGD